MRKFIKVFRNVCNSPTYIMEDNLQEAVEFALEDTNRIEKIQIKNDCENKLKSFYPFPPIEAKLVFDAIISQCELE